MLKKFAMAVVATTLLAACAGRPLQSGASRTEVLQRYGTPSRVVPLADGARLQYSFQPGGQSALMVDLDASGRLVTARQVLTPQNFARLGEVAIGKWTRADVENEFGRPALVDQVGSWRGDILNYRWRDGSQDMLFFVYLDAQGVVQRVGQGMEIRTFGDFVF